MFGDIYSLNLPARKICELFLQRSPNYSGIIPDSFLPPIIPKIIPA